MKFKLLLTTILVSLFGHVHACKCGGLGTVKESFKYPDIIVHGKILSKEIVPFEETINRDKIEDVKQTLKNDSLRLNRFESYRVFKITFEVIKNYKGAKVKDTVTVFTTIGSGSCGLFFVKVLK